MKEAWSMRTVKEDWSRPTLLAFNDWLKDKAEAHERMKISTTKPRNDESTQSVTRSLSWISEYLATKLNVKGLPTKLTVHGINFQQVVDTQSVELKLTPVHSGGSCSTFDVKPYVRKSCMLEMMSLMLTN